MITEAGHVDQCNNFPVFALQFADAVADRQFVDETLLNRKDVDRALVVPIFFFGLQIVERNIPDLLPNMKKIQERGKSLIIDGFMSWDGLTLLANTLDRTGLYFHVKADTLDEAKRLSDRFHDHYGSS